RRKASHLVNHLAGVSANVMVILHDQLGGNDFSGKLKLKVEPLPTSLSTQIFPRVARQISWPRLALAQSLLSCERSRLPPGEIPQRSLSGPLARSRSRCR